MLPNTTNTVTANTAAAIEHRLQPKHPALQDGHPVNAAKDNPASATKPFWGDDGFTFGDMLDIINPLQHIPVVSSVYRTVTGDEISGGAKMAGGTLFGGMLGMMASFFDIAMQESSGKGMDSYMTAWLKPDQAQEDTPTQLAVQQVGGESAFVPVETIPVTVTMVQKMTLLPDQDAALPSALPARPSTTAAVDKAALQQAIARYQQQWSVEDALQRAYEETVSYTPDRARPADFDLDARG